VGYLYWSHVTHLGESSYIIEVSLSPFQIDFLGFHTLFLFGFSCIEVSISHFWVDLLAFKPRYHTFEWCLYWSLHAHIWVNLLALKTPYHPFSIFTCIEVSYHPFEWFTCIEASMHTLGWIYLHCLHVTFLSGFTCIEVFITLLSRFTCIEVSISPVWVVYLYWGLHAHIWANLLALPRCIFKREAALWNPVVFFKREAALWNPVVFFFLICNGHCCQTQAKKCQFKGKVTFRSIRFW